MIDVKYATRTTCRVCGSRDLTPLFSLGEQLVSDFVDRDKVHAGPRCPIDVEVCGGCTLVQAKHTAPQDFLYTRKYWYRSGVTETMRTALKDVVDAARKVAKVQPGDVVLDIGSNDGTLLRCWGDYVVRVGVEPATNLATEENYGNLVYLIKDFWGADGLANDFESCHGQAKVITACGMFYDADDPNKFIADVAKVLAQDGVFMAQLMCLKQTLDACDVGNFAHEHLEFYTLRSLEVLFGKHGLEMFDVQENAVNGGSYRLFVRHKTVGVNQSLDALSRVQRAFKAEEGILDRVDAFHREMVENRRACREFVLREVGNGKRVWIYGASTKGNVILQWLNLDNRVLGGAADRSPEKWGKFTAGTGVPIHSEEEARKENPDFFLLLPYAFKDEILLREAAWRAGGGKFLIPLPKFTVV